MTIGGDVQGEKPELYSFLGLGLLNAAIHEVNRAVEEVSKKHPSLAVSEGALDLSSIYTDRPPRGGAHLARAAFFEPMSRIGTTIMFANCEDAWMTLFNVVASRLSGEHLLARSDMNPIYPLTDLEVLVDGELARYVGARRDDPSWVFFEKGVARPFEDQGNYKRRRIRDRFNREILFQYLASAGWDLSDPRFWRTGAPCIYVQEVRSTN